MSTEKPVTAIITPHVLSDRPSTYLLEAYESLLLQTVPWRWYIVGNADIDYLIQNDSRIVHIKTQSKYPAGTNRNIALSYVEEPLLTCLDDDDVLPSNSLKTRLQVYEQDTKSRWVVGDGEDLVGADLSPCRLPLTTMDATSKRILPGTIKRLWGEGLGVPFLPTGVLVETELVIEFGGWGGLPQLEDFFLLAPLMNSVIGRAIPNSVYHYRKHHKQMTKAPHFFDLEFRMRKLLTQRMNLL